MTDPAKQYLYALASAFAIAAAWLVPDSGLGAALGWLGALLTIPVLRDERHFYRPLYAAGVVTNLIGFYWLAQTIHIFGGFPWWAASLVFALFAGLSAVQYLIFGFCYRHLPLILERYSLRAALAWILAEYVSIRLFPWHLGHTQLGWPEIAQIADLGGTLLVSFLMFWVAAAVWTRLADAKYHRFSLSAFAALELAWIYGYYTLQTYSFVSQKGQTVAMVQANVTSTERNNVRYFISNTDRYLALTKQLAEQGKNLLIVWPESSFQAFIPDDLSSARLAPRLPYYQRGHALLIGTLSYDPKTAGYSNPTMYNSALPINADGGIAGMYHKRILMPFGEFMPLAAWFPALRQLNPNVGDFSAGADVAVFDLVTGENRIKTAPLICYEDTLPGPARESVQKGAELLINLTNDSWFGDTVEPYQHNQIAAFRAIENRRFLLRSTKTGLTALIDPAGRTIRTLPPFSEGILKGEIWPIQETTWFTRVGNNPWLLLFLLLACLITRSKAINMKAALRRRESKR